MTKKDRKPSRLAEWFLGRIYSEEDDPTRLGDFREVFQEIHREKSLFYARAWYWCQLLRSLPGWITHRLYWSTQMFKNYMLLSIRNLHKNKGYALINISGLAVGMACFILILTYIRFETSFDRFHEKAGNIYRIIQKASNQGDAVTSYSTGTSELLGPALVEDIPEIVRASRIVDNWLDKAVLHLGDKTFLQNGLFADNNFLKIFSFPLVHGDFHTALEKPGSVILTESTAQKFFENGQALGKMISLRLRNNNYDLQVAGIMEDVPMNSHLQFDFLVSEQTLRAEKRLRWMYGTWDIGNFTTYVELAKGHPFENTEKKFPSFIKKHHPGMDPLYLQPLKDIHLKSNLERESATKYEIRQVYLFTSIAFIILMIACINTMNLATARSFSRTREIGMRKVTGADRSQLFRQFMSESFLVTFISLLMSLFLVRLFLPRFQMLTGVDLHVDVLNTPSLFLIVLVTFSLTAVLSGIYPALVLSSLPPLSVFREFQTSGKKGSLIRNVLVVVQFSSAVILIAVTLVVISQLNFIRNKNLGFDREHVVVFPLLEKETRNKAEAMQNALLQYPEVLDVTASDGLAIDIRSRLLGLKLKSDQGTDVKMELCFDYVDEHFLNVFKIKLVQGRNLSSRIGSDKNGILLNETAVKHLGWRNPIGKILTIFRGKHEVIGIVKDFHFASLHKKIEPMALLYSRGSNIAVRFKPGNAQQRISLLKDVFKKHSSTQPFTYFFLDESYNNLYKKEQRTAELFALFAVLSIFISCLGLLGIASFSVEQRTKEIGIRKVLGASLQSIVGLLMKDSVRMVLIANIFALPIAVYAAHLWLQDFSYRIRLPLGVFFLASFLALLLAALVTVLQSLRPASADPVETLRYE
ncbi:MAG: ABC transporter permease [Candidatus Aminicenantes bacterium]|nr:ABC transporter permease [Candidatus Aminicenantes bacterium]